MHSFEINNTFEGVNQKKQKKQMHQLCYYMTLSLFS